MVVWYEDNAVGQRSDAGKFTKINLVMTIMYLPMVRNQTCLKQQANVVDAASVKQKILL